MLHKDSLWTLQIFTLFLSFFLYLSFFLSFSLSFSLKDMFGVLGDLTHSFGFHFTNGLFVFGLKYSASNRTQTVLINFL